MNDDQKISTDVDSNSMEKKLSFGPNKVSRASIEIEHYNLLRSRPGFFSPSKIKKLSKGQIVSKSTEAKALGTNVHSALEARLKGQKFHIQGPFKKEDGTAMKRGSAASNELYRELCAERGLTEDQCVILTDSEFQKIARMIPLLTKYVDKTIVGFPLESIYIEDTLMAGREALIKYSPITPVFQRLKESFMEVINASKLSHFDVFMGRPDLYGIEKDKSGIHIWDWKTTVKDDLVGIKSQIEYLDYYFSLFMYCVLLEMIWQLPIKTINLVMAPKSTGATGLLVYMNEVTKLDDNRIKGLSSFFRDTDKTSKYINFGQNVFSVMSKSGYAVIHN